MICGAPFSRRMKHCNLCGRAVAPNEYRVYTRKVKPAGKGLTICAQCERDKPRCLVCQTPMANAQARLGICADCLREGLHCRSCGQKIAGDFLMVNGTDGPYCMDCHRKFAACEICGAPVGTKPVTFADGRIVCTRCYQTALTNAREANELFEQVLDQLGSVLHLQLNIRPKLSLVDHARLMELARTVAQENGHEPERVMGLFMRQGRKRFIYLQEDLPRILFIQIVAHEFAHAWQGENAPLLADPILREGFAEWVAYHMLQELGAQKKVVQMLQRQDLYGQGLEYWLGVEKEQGLAGVIQSVRAPQFQAQSS